jgi:hypothetical protein
LGVIDPPIADLNSAQIQCREANDEKARRDREGVREADQRAKEKR